MGLSDQPNYSRRGNNNLQPPQVARPLKVIASQLPKLNLIKVLTHYTKTSQTPIEVLTKSHD